MPKAFSQRDPLGAWEEKGVNEIDDMIIKIFCAFY
jgi:hypothetical protein